MPDMDRGGCKEDDDDKDDKWNRWYSCSTYLVVFISFFVALFVLLCCVRHVAKPWVDRSL